MNPNNANNPQIIVPDDFPKDMQIILNMVRPLVTEEEFADWINWDEENTKEEEKEQLRADMYNFLQEHGAYLKAKALREQKEMQTQPNFNQSVQPAQPAQNTFNNSVDSLTNSSQSAFNPNLSPQANFNPNFQPPNQQNQVNQVNQMSNPINPPATDFNFNPDFNPSTNIPDFSQFTNSAGNLQPNFNSAVNSTINPANAIPNQVQVLNSNFNPGQFNFNPVNTGQAGGFVQEYQPQPQQLVQPQQQSQALNSQVAFQEIPQFVPPVVSVTPPTLEPIAPVNVESQVPEPILEFNQEFTRQIPPMQISENGDLITDKMPEAEFKVEEAMPTNIPTIPAVEPKVEPKIEILDQSFRSQTQPQARPERVERADNRDRNQDRNQVNQNTQTTQPQARPERTERVERNDRSERTERNQPNQSNQNTQTTQPQARSERTNKPDRSERTERNQPNQSNQNTQTTQPQTRPERTERVERTDNRDRNQDRGQDRNQGFVKKNNFNSSSISNISSNLDLDELYTTMNDLEKQKLQLQSAYYEKQQGLTQRIMELESKVVNLDIFSEKLKDVSSELNAHSAVVQDVKTSIGNIGSVSLQTQINNLRDEMRKTYREISYDLESVMREFSEFRLALSKGYQKMVEQLPETNINKENNN